MNHVKNRGGRRLGVAAVSLALGAAVLAQVTSGAGPAERGFPGLPATRPTTGPATRPVDPNKVVLSVGDYKMTAAEFDAIIASLPPETQMMARGPAKRRLAEEFVKLKVLSAEAQRQGLDQTPKFKQQMELMRDNALANLLAEKLQETLVPDEDLRKHYESQKQKYEKVTARHILIATRGEKGVPDAQAKAKAEDLKKQLDKGGDFAALAKANSADPGSAARGGELEAVPRGELVPEFENVAFGQEVNQISQPVKTPYGYHIIQTTKKEVSPFEQVKEEIAQQLRPQKFEQVMEELKKKASPTVDESFFGPAPATRPAGFGNRLPGDAEVGG